MRTVIDCRGMVCPQPVIKTKEVLDELAHGTVEVIVDNDASKSNVARFGKSQGCEVEIRSSGKTHHVTINKGKGAEPATDAQPVEAYTCEVAGHGNIYVIPADTMGRGNDPLGNVLMRAFIKTIKSIAPLPRKIFFYNTGVKITATESDLIEPLRELAERGVKIYSCGTCLDFFNLSENLLVGEVTNMFDIMDSMRNADKVISPY
ncbi:sulfurtransferase-like selenium metabolism protein YedF [Thiovibrio sp. JS02]